MTGIRGVGEAGRRGPDVRSDCWASVELMEEGGIDLRIASKVDALYGDSIRATVSEVLRAMGAEDVRLTIDDKGALPWVLRARVEAAYRRAIEHPESSGASGVAGGSARGSSSAPFPSDPRPPLNPRRPPAEGTQKDRLRRSRLYLPGNEPKFMINAGLHAPDGVILDLEDSVHPGEKDAARILVRNALRCIDFGAAERMVRINQLPLGLADLDFVIPEGPDMILVPKVEHADELRTVGARIVELRSAHNVVEPVWLMPILESALGIENAFPIASATDTVAALTIGLEDFTADLGVVKTPEGNESLWARYRLVNAARAAGVQAIDSVYGDVADEEGLLAWGQRARSLGFVGMGCIHPRQIRIIHRAFAPSTEELTRAQRIVAAFEEAQAKGLGVVSLGSKMIDRPVVLRARRLVERAREAGLLHEAEAERGEAVVEEGEATG